MISKQQSELQCNRPKKHWNPLLAILLDFVGRIGIYMMYVLMWVGPVGDIGLGEVCFDCWDCMK
jgi:hypothetical protein